MLIFKNFILTLLLCAFTKEILANTDGNHKKQTQCVCMAGNNCDKDLLALLRDKLMGWQLYPYSAEKMKDLANTALRMTDLFVKNDPEKLTSFSILKCLTNPVQKPGAFRKNAHLTDEDFSNFMLAIIYRRPDSLFRNLKGLALEEHTLVHLRKHIMQEVDDMPGDTAKKRQLIDLLQQMKSWMDIKFSRNTKPEAEPSFNLRRTLNAKDRSRRASNYRSDTPLQNSTNMIDTRQLNRKIIPVDSNEFTDLQEHSLNEQDRAFKAPSPTNTAITTPSHYSQSSRRSCFSNNSSRAYNDEELPLQNNSASAKPSKNSKQNKSSRKIIPVETKEFTDLQEH